MDGPLRCATAHGTSCTEMQGFSPSRHSRNRALNWWVRSLAGNLNEDA